MSASIAMNANLRRILPFVVCLLGTIGNLVSAAPAEDGATKLLEAYATQPHRYPAGKEYAQPDTAVPFRWHFYHAGAIERFDDVPMLTHVDPLNPLTDGGVRTATGSAVKWQFVADQAAEGKRAVQVAFPADVIKNGTAVIHLETIAGGQSFSEYLRARKQMASASCYGPHYRWIKLNVHNPHKGEVRVRLSGAPFVLHPGRNIVAVKTADAVERHYQCLFNSTPFEVTGPAEDVRLTLDHLRVEQELPAVISRKGKMFQFPARSDVTDPPVLAPGFTAIEADTLYAPERGFGWTDKKTTRQARGHTFRSNEHGVMWGCITGVDAPLRIDVPNGRYGIFVFGAPNVSGFQWSKGLTAKVNGREQALLQPQTDAEVRRTALGGELWDYRPGACVWEALVRRPYYPAMQVLDADATDKHLLIEFPKTIALHALMIFPEADREAALKEIGRFNYLLAESWDVSRPWVKGRYAQKAGEGRPYIGFHDEMFRPETIPDRLTALKLTEADYQRGFVLFQRGLTEAVYSDTIPTPAETGFKALACQGVPGQRICTTLGLLPLMEVKGLRVTVDDLNLRNGGRIDAKNIDVRLARQHQKTMQFGHHNHDFNYQEHYLVHRPEVDLYPAAARRVYLDITIPVNTEPGSFAGTVWIRTADGKPAAMVPLTLEVLPLKLEEGPAYFASNLNDPRLKEYGLNTFVATYDEAVKHGYKGYVANGIYGPLSFQGKKIGWDNFQDNVEKLKPIIAEGRAGKGPRGFFGGLAPGTYGNPNAAAISKEFYNKVQQAVPQIDLLSITIPTYFHGGYKGLQQPHEWTHLAAAPLRPSPKEALEAAHSSGKEFWFIDGIRHSKEQVGRFTFGFWLWRLGAAGRYTTLQAHLFYGGGTARATYPWEPYYTSLDVTGSNLDHALKDSVIDGQVNPSRDLVLIREGIDDFRYIHALDVWIERAEAKKAGGAALGAAKKFRDDLRAEISLDLNDYYEARAGAYGENWFALPANPWKNAKFDEMRAAAARHILALKKALAE